MKPESASALLAIPRRQQLLEHIWQRTSVSRRQFDVLYRAPLERYAELVQQFPASESHHHAWPGGMLDHGLEIVAYALRLRQSHLLPAGAPPETQAAQADAWTAGIAYAALLHDLGKIAVDLHVEDADGAVWHPWHGPLRRPYRFRYRKDRQYRLHGAATGLLYTRVLDTAAFDWLSGFGDLWAALLYVLAGQYEHAGILGELVVRADQASVAQALGGDPSRAMAAPRQALQRKLLEGLRHLLKEKLKLNQPQASDGWLTQDALWLVSKTVSDKLRAHLLAQGIEGIPTNNATLFDVMQDHGLVQATREGKAVWKATITSDAGWSHSFTLLRVAPSAIWGLDERPPPFAGSVTVESASEGPSLVSTSDGAGDAAAADAVASAAAAETRTDSETRQADVVGNPGNHANAMDELLSLLDTNSPEPRLTAASHAAETTASPMHALATASPSFDATRMGDHFLAWLRQGIQSRKLIINDAKALVHTVGGTAFLVSPGLFQRYGQEHPHLAEYARQAHLADWQWVQKQFEHLHMHRKQANGLNIWTCDVTGPRKSRRVHGYLIEDPTQLFDSMPPDNPYLSVKAPASPERIDKNRERSS